jgi:hypothetical protein
MDNDALTVQQHHTSTTHRLAREVEAKIRALQLQTGQHGYSQEFCTRMLEAINGGQLNADPATFAPLYQPPTSPP